MNTAVEDRLIGRNLCRVKDAGLERSAKRPVLTIAQVFGLTDVIDQPVHLRSAYWATAGRPQRDAQRRSIVLSSQVSCGGGRGGDLAAELPDFGQQEDQCRQKDDQAAACGQDHGRAEGGR